MSYSVYPTPDFKKSLKKLLRKYPSLKSDLKLLIDILKEKPDSGVHLGHGIYKIRLAIASKVRGKSGGARVITFLVTKYQEIYLVYIYDKSQLDNISKEQIIDLLNKTGLT